MKTNKNVIRRNVAGDDILIPVHDSAKEHNGLFVLTELGDFIWDLLPEAESEEAILSRILEEYEVDEATAKADLTEFIDKLRNMGIL